MLWPLITAIYNGCKLQMASINLEKLAFEVDKIYIKSISVVKGSKYPHKQHIKNRPKSDLIDKKYKFNQFLNNFLKPKKVRIMNYTIFLRF